jgi:hypothetical protein
MGKMYRQGDVLIREVSNVQLPKNEQLEIAQKDARGIVLAEGETSGHFHGVLGKGNYKLFNYKDGNGKFLVIEKECADVRVIGGGIGGVDRHTPITLPIGNYKITVQRSWNSSMQSRQVQD